MQHILVVFFSFSNATRKLAEEIARQTGGELRELIPDKPYAFDYNTAAKEVRREMESGHCPKLQSGAESAASYDCIFIGTPNWFKSFAPPVLSFLRSVDLRGKTIIPFCTHGGGGMGQIDINMAKECPHSTLLPGFASAGDVNTGQVSAWLREIEVIPFSSSCSPSDSGSVRDVR